VIITITYRRNRALLILVRQGQMMSKDKDRLFLEMALEEAEHALKDNTYPVGAVIVDENFNLISRGRNRVHPANDALHMRRLML
jgi:tRNA(adenine34) deaminase